MSYYWFVDKSQLVQTSCMYIYLHESIRQSPDCPSVNCTELVNSHLPKNLVQNSFLVPHSNQRLQCPPTHPSHRLLCPYLGHSNHHPRPSHLRLSSPWAIPCARTDYLKEPVVGSSQQPVATRGGNHGCRSLLVSVSVAANSNDLKTGPGPIVSKKGKKTRLDRTFKHYHPCSVHSLSTMSAPISRPQASEIVKVFST